MRWVVWWSLGVLVACGRSESHSNEPFNTSGGAGSGGGGRMASTGGASAGTPNGGGNAGRSGHAGQGGSSNTAGVGGSPTLGGAAGKAGSESTAGSTVGGAGSTAGASGSDAGGASGAGDPGGAGMSGAPGEDCGEFVECGCGCCGGSEPSNTLCYYPERGDTLEALRAADEMAAMSPSCPNAGCALGTRRVCCEASTDDGAGTYSASGYSGGLDHLNIFREGPPGHCTALELSAPSGTEHPFAIDLPQPWRVMAAIDGPCGMDGSPSGTVRPAIGGIGSVMFVDGQCTLAVDATLFFLTDGGAVEAVRLLAANLPAEGPLACQ